MPININSIRYPKGLCYIKPCAWDIGTRFGASCPQTCLSVTSPSDLPDPAGDCTFAQVRESSANGVIVTLVEWDGASWVLLASVETINAGAVIDSADYRTYGTWTATINGTPVSGVGSVDFDPDATEVDVVFINGACSYAMEPAITTPVELMVWNFVDITLAPFDYTDPVNWTGVGAQIVCTSVDILGNQATLYGYATGGYFTDNYGFLNNTTNIVYIGDSVGFIEEVAAYTFNTSTISTSFPALRIVGEYAYNAAVGDYTSTVIETIGDYGFGGSVSGCAMPQNSCVSIGQAALSGSGITSADFPLITTIPASCFADCLSLATVNFPLATSIGDEAFNCSSAGTVSDLTVATFPNVLTIGFGAFYKAGLTSIDLPVCTAWTDDGGGFCQIFRECTNLVEVIAPALTNMGGTVGDNQCFLNITGNTIDLTVPAALLTVNGGNPDGDIQYLQANNTVNLL